MEGEIGTLTAGVKAETSLTADTETLIATISKGFDLTIHEINWTYANVVDAKAMTGYIEVKFSSGKTPHRFPVGFGTGGAATLEQKKKGKLDVSIPVKANDQITIYATMCENCVAGFAGIKYTQGLNQGQQTFEDCNTVEDAAISADTLSAVGSITIPPEKGGRCKKVLVSYANVVNAKGAGGYVDLSFSGGDRGAQRYIVGGGSGGATNAGGSVSAEEIEVDFEVKANEVVTFNIYLAEAAVDGHIGLQWVK